jgi:hypothetical protein
MADASVCVAIRMTWGLYFKLIWWHFLYFVERKKNGKKKFKHKQLLPRWVAPKRTGEPSDVLFLIIICNDYSYHCSNDLRNTKSIGERTMKKKTRQFLNSIVMIFMIIESNKKIVECAGCFCFATPKNQFQKINKKIIMDKNE